MTRALVLGGGGPVGVAWESGLVAGLGKGGVDLGVADAIIGTSAGSFVGAQLALGIDLAGTVASLPTTRVAFVESGVAMPPPERMEALMTALASSAEGDAPPEEARRDLGKLALEEGVVTEEEFLGFFAVLEGREWPERFACTAIDTASGEFVVWRAGSDVDVWHAVASSCSVPLVFPPVTIGGKRYMDGGMRSPLNADVAVGHDKVLVVSVMVLSLPPGVSNPLFEAMMSGWKAEMETLKSSGSTVEIIGPSTEFLEISGWGASLMDIDKAADAYEAGTRQGFEESARVGQL